jgi:hypothetical protein
MAIASKETKLLKIWTASALKSPPSTRLGSIVTYLGMTHLVKFSVMDVFAVVLCISLQEELVTKNLYSGCNLWEDEVYIEMFSFLVGGGGG